MINALTVDVEDWYQSIENIPFEEWGRYEDRVERSVDRLLELFALSGVKGTFFVLGWVAEKHRKMVARIHGEGHEIGTHGYSHRFIYNLGPELFKEELRRSVSTLEEITGTKVLGHRASAWTITERSKWALDMLLEEGLSYDSSITSMQTYLNGYPGFPEKPFIIRSGGGKELIEFPMTTFGLFNKRLPTAGGFFTRAYPYWLIKHGINRANREGRPANFYIHPWDIDTEQPRLKLPLKLRRHYFNLKSTEGKLKSLLRDFEFTTVKELLLQEGVGYAR
jgi:polysaccharide deacetylase family protein (PEP-CTERM system associated)